MLVDLISRETGIVRPYLELIGRTASHRYKCYPIKKRNGDDRIIAHPSRQLKFIQRWLVGNLFGHLPVHPAATAYGKDCGVRANAAMHVEGNFLLKLDVEGFFPSISYADILWFLTTSAAHLPLELTEEDRVFVARIVTRKGALPVGAPSSPVISNMIMYDFDRVICDECQAAGVSYTRYADDMCFSTDEGNVLSAIHRVVVATLANSEHPKLRLNSKKTVYTSRRRKRMVTGLVLTSDRKISLGRHMKRSVRSLLHQLKEGKLDIEKREYLSGYLSYANSVEPTFIEALGRKYGAALVGAASGKIAEF